MQGNDTDDWHSAKLELEKFKIAQKVKEHVFGAGGATGAIRTLYDEFLNALENAPEKGDGRSLRGSIVSIF